MSGDDLEYLYDTYNDSKKSAQAFFKGPSIADDPVLNMLLPDFQADREHREATINSILMYDEPAPYDFGPSYVQQALPVEEEENIPVHPGTIEW